MTTTHQKTALIVKLGYCETLVHEAGFVPSLGDVFRHTVLLHRFADHRVTWVTSEPVVPLLKDNPLIAELIVFEGQATVDALARREFDTVICLEKAPLLCAMAGNVKAGERFGFGWDGNNIHAYPLAHEALAIANGKKSRLYIQDLLFQLIGAVWQGEDYLLGYAPTNKPAFDVGLNYQVGTKWPSKAWPMDHWKMLATLCRRQGWSVSWQQGAKDLYHYMDWIHSCRTIVTCDSLGMHLGLALKKQVVALFGPTFSDSIYMYGRGVILRAECACKKVPCMQPACDNGKYCMEEIRPAAILGALRHYLPAKAKRRAAARALREPTEHCPALAAVPAP
ncbi:MAG: glycosyltransferase family 9 protein [Lentisphaerae bacterium]|nr:glycosyltransferase family 9 protein [Lentisphaerota bacterium]